MPNKYWTGDPDKSEKGSAPSLSNCQTSDITEPDENFGSVSTESLIPQQAHEDDSVQITTSKGRAYKDPDIDTTERLSDIDPNFNRAKGTKKLKDRVIDRWHRFVLR